MVVGTGSTVWSVCFFFFLVLLNWPCLSAARLSVEGQESETANSNWIYDARFTPGSKGEFLDVGGPGMGVSGKEADTPPAATLFELVAHIL